MKIEHKKKLFTKNTVTVLAVVILYIIVSYLTYSGGASRRRNPRSPASKSRRPS